MVKHSTIRNNVIDKSVTVVCAHLETTWDWTVLNSIYTLFDQSSFEDENNELLVLNWY